MEKSELDVFFTRVQKFLKRGDLSARRNYELAAEFGYSVFKLFQDDTLTVAQKQEKLAPFMDNDFCKKSIFNSFNNHLLKKSQNILNALEEFISSPSDVNSKEKYLDPLKINFVKEIVLDAFIKGLKNRLDDLSENVKDKKFYGSYNEYAYIQSDLFCACTILFGDEFFKMLKENKIDTQLDKLKTVIYQSGNSLLTCNPVQDSFYKYYLSQISGPGMSVNENPNICSKLFKPLLDKNLMKLKSFLGDEYFDNLIDMEMSFGNYIYNNKKLAEFSTIDSFVRNQEKSLFCVYGERNKIDWWKLSELILYSSIFVDKSSTLKDKNLLDFKMDIEDKIWNTFVWFDMRLTLDKVEYLPKSIKENILFQDFRIAHDINFSEALFKAFYKTNTSSSMPAQISTRINLAKSVVWNNLTTNLTEDKFEDLLTQNVRFRLALRYNNHVLPEKDFHTSNEDFQDMLLKNEREDFFNNSFIKSPLYMQLKVSKSLENIVPEVEDSKPFKI